MGIGCPLPTQTPQPDQELVKQITEASSTFAVQLPTSFAIERGRIVNEMKTFSPKPYENLFYKDYPGKNASKVNELALRNVTSEEVRKGMADEINQHIQPKVDEQMVNMNPAVKRLFQKLVEKSVEQAVNKAFDAFIEKMHKGKKNV